VYLIAAIDFSQTELSAFFFVWDMFELFVNVTECSSWHL